MSLYKQWNELIENQENEEKFWKEFFVKERDTYKYLLENHKKEVNGTIEDLAKKFSITDVEFVGFLDGINSSLKESIDLENLDNASSISLKIDFEKLFYNMLDAKADWLYTLDEWNGILDEEARKSIKKEYNKSKMAVSTKVGRNDPCTCGSGKKYKKCCGK